MTMNARALAPLWRFTVADYYRMAEAGILKPNDRVELIEGEIVEMSPIGSRHAGCVDQLNELLHSALRGKPFQIRVQNPVRLSDVSEPEPDISVLLSREDFYTQSHPTAAEVVLLIEVADASLAYDRHTKVPLYLGSGIQEVWLVDLVNHTIDVQTAAGVRHFSRGAVVVSSVLPELTIAVDDIVR